MNKYEKERLLFLTRKEKVEYEPILFTQWFMIYAPKPNIILRFVLGRLAYMNYERLWNAWNKLEKFHEQTKDAIERGVKEYCQSCNPFVEMVLLKESGGFRPSEEGVTSSSVTCESCGFDNWSNGAWFHRIE